MEVAVYVEEQGGFADRALLLATFGAEAVDASVARGELVTVGRRRLALPTVDAAARTAIELSGVLSLTSAAMHHGWEVLRPPDEPHVTVPRHRRIPAAVRARCHLHRHDLDTADVDGVSTTVETTLRQCLRALPDVEALAIADSALRHRVAPAVLEDVAKGVRGPGSPHVRRLLAAADGEAANPFESALRALCHEVPGLAVSPQQVVRGSTTDVQPDLVVERLGIVVEADSFAFHSGRDAFARDLRRYNMLTVDGWLVLRFGYTDVVSDPEHVRSVLAAAVRCAAGRTEVRRELTEAGKQRAAAMGLRHFGPPDDPTRAPFPE